MEKYEKKLRAKNAFDIKQLIVFVKNIIEFLQKNKNSEEKEDYKRIRILDFLLEVNGGGINFPKLNEFLENSQLSKKLNMFNDNNNLQLDLNKTAKSAFNEKLSNISELNEVKHNIEFNILDKFVDFLNNLITTNDLESSFFIKYEEKFVQNSINLLRINPKSLLKELVDECHSIILAGGTMEPVSIEKKKKKNRIFFFIFIKYINI